MADFAPPIIVLHMDATNGRGCAAPLLNNEGLDRSIREARAGPVTRRGAAMKTRAVDLPPAPQGDGVGDVTIEARRITADAAGKLQQFCGSAALAAGQINLLSLDPIAFKLGPKWAGKRESVYDYTERTLEKHLGETGFHMRVSETDFLVVLPNDSQTTAQVRCLRFLSGILTYFLGEARPSDLTVRAVTRIMPDGLEAMLVDPNLTLSADSERPVGGVKEPGLVDRWTPFIASNGKKVRVSCRLEPIVELKHYGRIGYRIARRVLYAGTDEPLSAAEIQSLSRADIERIDLATIARGLDRLRSESGGSDQLTVIVPVSFVSLSNRQGRAALAALFEEAKAFVKTGVICEVCDIEGVPQAALLEANTLMKPYCLFLVGRLTSAPANGLASLRNTGLQAVSFEAPQGSMDDAEFQGWAKAAIASVKPIAKSVMIYRLESARRAAIVGLLGASHASVRSAATTHAVAESVALTA